MEWKPPKNDERTLYFESDVSLKFIRFENIWKLIQKQWPGIEMSELRIEAEYQRVYFGSGTKENEPDYYMKYVKITADLEDWQKRMNEETEPTETYTTIIVPLETADQRINYGALYNLAFQEWHQEDISPIDFDVSRGSYPKDGQIHHYLCLHLIVS